MQSLQHTYKHAKITLKNRSGNAVATSNFGYCGPSCQSFGPGALQYISRDVNDTCTDRNLGSNVQVLAILFDFHMVSA